MPVEMKPLPRVPDDDDRKRGKQKTPKGKIYKLKENEKPVISLPSNFEHTVHVGFDPHTGEFTVSFGYDNVVFFLSVALQIQKPSENFLL